MYPSRTRRATEKWVRELRNLLRRKPTREIRSRIAELRRQILTGKSPIAKKPKKPVAKKPVAKKPKKPVAKKPVAKKLKKPVAKKPKKPVAKKPKKPVAKKPKKPVAKKPAAKKPKKPVAKKSKAEKAFEKLTAELAAKEAERAAEFAKVMAELKAERVLERQIFKEQLAALKLREEEWEQIPQVEFHAPPPKLPKPPEPPKLPKKPFPTGPKEQEELRKKEFPRVLERFDEIMRRAEEANQIEHVPEGNTAFEQSKREGFRWVVVIGLPAKELEEIMYRIERAVAAEPYRKSVWLTTFQVSSVGERLIGSGKAIDFDDPDAAFVQTDAWVTTGVWPTYEGMIEAARELLYEWASEAATHVFVRTAIVETFRVRSQEETEAYEKAQRREALAAWKKKKEAAEVKPE